MLFLHCFAEKLSVVQQASGFAAAGVQATEAWMQLELWPGARVERLTKLCIHSPKSVISVLSAARVGVAGRSKTDTVSDYPRIYIWARAWHARLWLMA